MSSRTLNKDIEIGSKANKTVLIVAEPGRIRDSLVALLKTIPQAKIVGLEYDSSLALKIITEYRPDLVLLVVNLLNEGARRVLEHLNEVPRTQSLVLTNTVLHMEEAEAAGADKVLLIGFPTHKLFESVTRLLSV